jgi:hypothetical protein
MDGQSSLTSRAEFVPLSLTEQARLRSLLNGVSSRTLLLSVQRLVRGNEDAETLILILLDRLTRDEDAIEQPVPPSCKADRPS